MISAFLSASLLLSPPSQSSAKVQQQRGATIIVEGDGVQQWRIGLPVVVFQLGAATAPPLPLADGRVRGVSGRKASIRLIGDVEGMNLRNAWVAPRYLVEAELFAGELPAPTQPVDSTETVETPKPKPQAYHRSPKQIRWGQPLWLEITSAFDFSAVNAHVRMGPAGEYTTFPLKQRKTPGHWSGSTTLDLSDREQKFAQYFITATFAGKPHSIAGNPAHPNSVAVASAPRRPTRAIMQHQRIGRATFGEAVELTAKVDPRFQKPQLHMRVAGGGTFETMDMKALAPGIFTATIPAPKVVMPHFRYYLSAEDSEGLRLPGFASAMAPHRVKVTRGKILSAGSSRNRIAMSLRAVQNDPDDDHYTELTTRYERIFFPFLLARIGFSKVSGRSLRLGENGELAGSDLNLTGGEGGLKLRIKDYVSLFGDLQAVAYPDGSAFGTRFGLRIGDDRGAAIGFAYGSMRDVDDWSFIGETGEAFLSTPLGKNLRLTGRVETDDLYQDAQRSLRLLVEVSGVIWNRLEWNLEGGSSTRDGVGGGGVTRGRVGWLF